MSHVFKNILFQLQSEKYASHWDPKLIPITPTTVLLKGWLYYYITHESWLAINQRNKEAYIYYSERSS